MSVQPPAPISTATSAPALNQPIVPALFPRQSINLLIGHGGAGKTKIALSNFNHYGEGRGFLGYGLGPESLPIIPDTAHALLVPEQIGLISCTLSQQEWRNNVRPYSFLKDPFKFPLKVLGAAMNMQTLADAYNELGTLANRPVKFLLIEGIQHLMGKQSYSEPFPVRELFINLREFCETNDVTILGTVGCPKANMLTNYPRLGDKIYGGITWGQETHTLIGADEINENSIRRRIVIRHRDAMRQIKYADFNREGFLELVLVDDGVPIEPSNEEKLTELLASAAAGDELTWATFYAWGKKIGVSKATVERWVGNQTKPKGTQLEKISSDRPVVYHKTLIQ